MEDETASPDFSGKTFQPLEFKNYQTGAAWSGVEPIKAVNIKPGKENHHVKIVRDVLYSMYPHANAQGLYLYEVYMEKAVKKFQQDIGTPITGVLTEDELRLLGEKSGKFRLV